MRFISVLVFILISGLVHSQTTFIKLVESVVGEYSFGPTALFQRTDSSYMILYSHKVGSGHYSPAYIHYDKFGKVLSEKKLLTGIPHINYYLSDAIITSDDGIFLMANADGYYPHAIRYDKNFKELWRVFSDNRNTTNPKFKVPFKGVEVDNKIVCIGTDSNDYHQSVMVYNSTTGDSIKQQDLSEYCASCSDSTLVGKMYASSGQAFMSLWDQTEKPLDQWDVYQLKMLDNGDSVDTQELSQHTSSLSVRVFQLTDPDKVLILNDSLSVNQGYLLSRSVNTKNGVYENTSLLSDSINGRVYSVYDEFKDTKGNLYIHALIEGTYRGVRYQRVLFKFDKNGSLLKYTILYPFYGEEYHDLYSISQMTSTKSGGFAMNLKLNRGGLEPPQYFIVADSNLNVNGKPFYEMFISEDTTSNLASNRMEELQLSVYPNPTNGKINIDISNEDYKNFSIIIYNSKGQKVFTEKVASSKITIDIAWLSPLLIGQFDFRI